MTERQFFNILLLTFGGMAAGVFILLFFVSVPYGRHARPGWGSRVSNRWGWMLMEAPASILFFVYYLVSDSQAELVPFVFLFVWQSHYLDRAFFYPFRLQEKRSMTLTVLCLAVIFNLFNTYIQGRWIFTLSPASSYRIDWVTDPRFVIGLLLFYAGYALNRNADKTLRLLRKPGGSEYVIPAKGLFRRISCPNYLGEIIQWFGWAVALWSIPGLLFAFWTVANLLPRARSHHQWYKNTFPDYPQERKALVPYIL